MIPRIRLQELRLTLCVAFALVELGCGASRVAPPRQPAAVKPSPPRSIPLGPTAVYVVRSGDTLGRLAQCSGVSVARLAASNEISDPDVIRVGSRLRIPRGHRCVAGTLPARKAGSESTAVARAEGLLSAATARLDDADFENALSLSESCSKELLAHPRNEAAIKLRARCHVIAGMAWAGLHRNERAIETFRHAFALDPSLEFSPETTSPRVLELVSEARTAP
jgi:LysM repeat protein